MAAILSRPQCVHSLALRLNCRHFLIHFLQRKLEIEIYIAGCSLESTLKNISVSLDIDLALFRRQAIAGTSDDIDHRCIYPSPELNFYIAPLYDSRKISLFIYMCLFLYTVFYERHSYLWFYMYIYSLSLEIPLCSYHSSDEHYLYRCVSCISILPLLKLRIYTFMYWKSGTSDFWC